MDVSAAQETTQVATFVAKREIKLLKNLIVVCVTVVALGCAFGIYGVDKLSEARHSEACATTNRVAVVITKLVDRIDTAAPPKPTGDPILDKFQEQNYQQALPFKKFADKTLSTLHCT